MPNDNERLREEVRALLLPLPADGREDIALSALRTKLASTGIDESDQPEWIRASADEWRDSGVSPRSFEEAVEAAIEASDEELGADLADVYFAVHDTIKQHPGFDHDSATAVLSHARIISTLASSERMTAAQIARLVAARDPGLSIGRRQIGALLSAMHLEPSIEVDQVTYLFELDQSIEELVFADADDATVINIVAAVAERLGCREKLGPALETLIPPEGEAFTPYLQILHFQCSIAEYFDHALSMIYEFSPRGNAALALFDLYPDSMVGAGNPFLNNAKSVERLDIDWARSKKDAQSAGAHALVKVIGELEELGFAARKELAASIRRAIVRRIRLERDQDIDLPETLSREQLLRLLTHVKSSETFTAGIIEQRVVDFVSASLHTPPQWIGRGIGDPVNATNMSRNKLGDCDFQDVAGRSVVAYEAHGGRLTATYLKGHARTLRKSLAARQEEWRENFGLDQLWKLQVTFVAHTIALDPGEMTEFATDGAEVVIDATTYEELVDSLLSLGELDEALANELILTPLRLRRTPPSVKRALLRLIKGE